MRPLLWLTLLMAACDDSGGAPGGGALQGGEGEGEGEGGGAVDDNGAGEGEAGGDDDPNDGGGDGGGGGVAEGEGEGEGGDGGEGGEGEGEGEDDGQGGDDGAGEGEGEGEQGGGDDGDAGEGEGEVDGGDGGEGEGEGEGEVDGGGEGEGEGGDGGDGGDVVDDEYEENDTQDDAVRLRPGVYDLVMADDDSDWFSVDVCANGRLTVVSDSQDFTGELELAVHDAAGQELESDERAGNLGVVRVRSDGATTLYIRTWGFSGRSNDAYTLRIDVDCDVPLDDGFEDNDEFATASFINFGDHADLRIHPDDEDWYSFPACDNGRISIRIEFEDVLADLDLQLKDNNDRNLRQVFTRNDHEEIEYQFVNDMLAYLRVNNEGSWENDYTLSIQLVCP